ncbi:hypothetical protein NDU88_002610 [Pleurodeles waltl]|uniref:Uncharacterized protein n=1 Tax=Pleurodeles waltl TaxID=8319 RepID=A0AAV7LG26_PLEWA|nr:hypothetical protein NDU88_002610 [Pleurodeles waltl]
MAYAEVLAIYKQGHCKLVTMAALPAGLLTWDGCADEYCFTATSAALCELQRPPIAASVVQSPGTVFSGWAAHDESEPIPTSTAPLLCVLQFDLSSTGARACLYEHWLVVCVQWVQGIAYSWRLLAPPTLACSAAIYPVPGPIHTSGAQASHARPLGILQA